MPMPSDAALAGSISSSLVGAVAFAAVERAFTPAARFKLVAAARLLSCADVAVRHPKGALFLPALVAAPLLFPLVEPRKTALLARDAARASPL